MKAHPTDKRQYTYILWPRGRKTEEKIPAKNIGFIKNDETVWNKKDYEV